MHVLKKCKKLLVILIFMCTFFTLQRVYAYNLKFEVKYIEETEGKREARFTVSAGKSPKSNQEYLNAYKKDGVWVYNEGSTQYLFGAKNTPTAGNYIMKQLTFTSMGNVNTNYFNTSGTNSLAVSYLQNDNVIPYQDGSYIFGSGNKSGSVALTGNPGFQGAYSINTDTAEVRFKIQGDLNISEYRLNEMNFIFFEKLGFMSKDNGMVRVSSNNYTLKSDFLKVGLLDSQANMDMRTAWQYYGVTQPASGGSTWQPYTRGCGDGSTRSVCKDTAAYAKNSSINSYDNILVLPVAGKPRKVYVRYIDESGAVIGGVANEYSADGKKAISPIPEKSLPTGATQNDISEYYEIGLKDTITLEKYDIPGYDYLGYKQLVSLNLNTGYNTMRNSTTYSKGITRWTFKATGVMDYSFVNFVYKKKKEEYPATLTLQGVLNFKNRKNNTNFEGAVNNWFGPSTEDETSISSGKIATDYIASGFSLVPYISEAYPYVVRGLNYEYIAINPSNYYNKGKNKDGLNGVYQKTLSVYSQFDYTYKYYSSETVREGGSTSCEDAGITSTYTSCEAPLDKNGNCTEEPVKYEVHKVICKQEGPYKATASGYYSVPYDFRYFQLNNFKVYAIEKAEAIDSDSNTGGLLFSEPKTYMISVSQAYKDRFSSGFNKNSKGIVFGGSTDYDLGSVGDAGETWNWSVIQNKINATNKKVDPYRDGANDQREIAAINGASVTLKNAYNDSVNLDGGDVLVKNVAGDPISRGAYFLTDSDFWNKNNVSSNINKTPILGKTTIYMVKDANDYIGYLNNLQNYITPPLKKQTTINDWNKQDIDIIKERTNGVRVLTGKLYYKLLGVNGFDYGSKNFNVDGNSLSNVYGSFLDSRYKGITVNGNKADVSKLNVLSVLPVEHIISGKNRVNKVNVLTPLRLLDTELQISDKIVDHSTDKSSSNTFSQLQRNSWFTLTPNLSSYTDDGVKYSDIPTQQFAKYYYFVFDFAIAEAQAIVGDKVTNLAGPFEAGKVITIEANGQPATLKAKTTLDYNSPTVRQIQNKYQVFASAYNITNDLQEDFKKGITPFTRPSYRFSDANKTVPKFNAGTQNQSGLLGNSTIYEDAFHIVDTDIKVTSNLARIFDFRITDCTDVNFKNIFRKTEGTNVNTHTKQFYYSGTKTWLRNTVNTTVSTNTIRYLPLGPYKQEQYINAPKLGYRFSFDFKTSGYLTGTIDSKTYTRTATVKPSFYYISKDGKTFIPNIKLYYKNSAGKYVPINDYKIYFTPNDGYRYIDTETQNSPLKDLNISTMSNQLKSYNVYNETVPITLNNNFMATSNQNYYQTWVGEYKLPNSTVAFDYSKSIVDLKKPLTNGYIGVKFDITVTDRQGTDIVSQLNYAVNDRDTADESGKTAPNTSQWDYEGYMGFKTPGSPANVSVQLEKGTWKISNEIYQQVKGTVILYDADNRAANDFE